MTSKKEAQKSIRQTIVHVAESKLHELMEAILDGDVLAVKALIEEDEVDMNVRDISNLISLGVSLCKDKPDILKVQIEAGEDVNAKDGNG